MKRIFILLLTILPLISSTARAEKDRPITFEQLPQKAQQFIQKYFAEEKIAFAKSERDFFEIDYLVVFTSGKKIEFLRSGDWEKVDCRYSAVPTELIPAQITNKIKELYPEATVTVIDRGKYDIETKLNNGLELTFDLKYNLLDIDN